MGLPPLYYGLFNMIEYIKLSQFKNKIDIINLWNKEYYKIYPISEELFMRNSSNLADELSYVAIDERGNLVGFILSKIWEDKFKITSYDDTCWINLIYVVPKSRRLGIGSKLLELVEKEAEKIGKKNLYLGRDYCNYFPGLPVDLKNSCPWFEKKGFVRPYDTFDLIKNIDNPSLDKLKLRNDSYIFRISTLSDKDDLIAFMKKNWPGRWLKELIDYYENGGDGKEYVIALDNNNICAFAKIGYPNTDISLISYNMTWRNRFKALGGIGPLGVDTSYRKRNLGYDIVAFANNVLIDNKVSNIIIDWTGLVDFYRLMGFEVFKSYYYMNKTL